MWVNFHPARILSNLSTLLRALSSCSVFFLDLSMQSTLLLDFSMRSNETFSFSNLSKLLFVFSVLYLGFSLRSVLFRDASKQSVLLLAGSNRSVLFLQLFLSVGDFSTVEMNFFRCLMYSGKSSKSQWFPPLSHNGSYFSLQSSHSCLPWEQSTTSSEVPWLSQETRMVADLKCNSLESSNLLNKDNWYWKKKTINASKKGCFDDIMKHAAIHKGLKQSFVFFLFSLISNNQMQWICIMLYLWSWKNNEKSIFWETTKGGSIWISSFMKSSKCDYETKKNGKLLSCFLLIRVKGSRLTKWTK